MPAARTFDSASKRWAGVGPYYAMFPVDFANAVVHYHTRPGESVLDPFAGRGTSIFSAASTGRPAVGVEINPVGWVYGKTKLTPAPVDRVLDRLAHISELAEPPELPPDAANFFQLCFSPKTLAFLATARSLLDWRASLTDRTLMALILIYLHGKRQYALSNQMRQSKAMSPDYSVRWWTVRDLQPPEHAPDDFLAERIRWRYHHGTPEVAESALYLADTSRSFPRLNRLLASGRFRPFKLLFTSPPYYRVTNYFYDQWLRYWMLGGPWRPAKLAEPSKGKFESLPAYRELLAATFSRCSELMTQAGVVYVRTDAWEPTLEATTECLREAFPRWKMRRYQRPVNSPTQTALFGDKESKPGDVDIVLYGPRR